MLNYYSRDIDFLLSDKTKTTQWITTIVESYDKDVGDINYIFCSDAYLLELNSKYLKHDYLTDILTFSHYNTPSLALSADIYISIDRVKDNAQTYKVPFIRELKRVMIHGVLHLIGFDDHNENDKKAMREAEDNALKILEK